MRGVGRGREPCCLPFFYYCWFSNPKTKKNSTQHPQVFIGATYLSTAQHVKAELLVPVADCQDVWDRGLLRRVPSKCPYRSAAWSDDWPYFFDAVFISDAHRPICQTKCNVVAVVCPTAKMQGGWGKGKGVRGFEERGGGGGRAGGQSRRWAFFYICNKYFRNKNKKQTLHSKFAPGP